MVAGPYGAASRGPDRRCRRDDQTSVAVSAGLDVLSARARRLARRPDHFGHDLPDRRHSRPAGHLPFPRSRARSLCRGHGERAGAARSGRADCLHHGRRPLRQRLHRRTRFDEDARRDRRAAHHGPRSGRSAGAAADHRAGHRGAAADISRLDGGAVRRGPRLLGLCRHGARHLSGAAATRPSGCRRSRSA